MPETPKYSLLEVQKLIEIEESRDASTDENESVWFSAPSKSLWAVIAAFEGESTGPVNVDEARVFIFEGIKHLTEKHFIRRSIQWNDPNCIADNYGLIFSKRHWFIKFLMEDGALEDISFHPPERDDVTVGGIQIRKEQ